MENGIFAGIWHNGHELNFLFKNIKQKWIQLVFTILWAEFVWWSLLLDLNEDCNKVSKNEVTEFKARKKFKNISDLSELQLNYLKENQN